VIPGWAGPLLDHLWQSTWFAAACALLRSSATENVKGRARYLYELSPELQRSLSSRWLR